MQEIKIGPTKDEIIKKYKAKFFEFPLLVKLKIVTRISLDFLIVQFVCLLYWFRILKAPQIKTNAEVDLREHAYKNRTGEHYLTDSEIDFFNENGYIPPFKVIDREQALKLNEVIRKKIMAGKIVYGPFPDMDHEERMAKIAETKLRDDLESRGWNRHFNIPEIYDLFSRDEITYRLASLFGKDVYLWRSQLFPVPSGSQGTALHQVTNFHFAMDKKVLVEDERVPKSLVNLTAWIALTDVDETNAAMILVKGSHKNNRFEQSFTSRGYCFSQAKILDRLLILFVHRTANDAHARFDITNLFIKQVQKREPELLQNKAFVSAKMKAGQAIIFTSRTIHGSHANITDNERLAIGGRYTSSAVKVYPDPGDYREINHFRPHHPVILDKYKKTFKVCSIE